MQKIGSISLGLTLAMASLGWGSLGCGIDDSGTKPVSTGTGSSGGGEGGSISSGMGGTGGTGMSNGGAGGAGGSGGASSSSSSSSAASSSGMVDPELCNDGMDNDKDSLVDCADEADCGTLFTCNTLPAGGWSFVRIRQTAFQGATEPCAGGAAPTVLYEGPDQGQCNNCSCTAGGDCTITMTCYSDSDCTFPSTTRIYTTDNDACTMDPIAAGSCQLTGSPIVPSTTMCKSQGGGLKNADPYAGEVHVCLTESKTMGCGTDKCVLAPSGTYEDRLCVAKMGQQACPVGFPERHVGFGSYADSRSCSMCSCEQSAITCSGNGFVTLWYDAACGSAGPGVGTNSGCVKRDMPTNGRNVTDIPQAIVPQANCPKPFPLGSVTGFEANTVCCAAP